MKSNATSLYDWTGAMSELFSFTSQKMPCTNSIEKLVLIVHKNQQDFLKVMLVILAIMVTSTIGLGLVEEPAKMP